MVCREALLKVTPAAAAVLTQLSQCWQHIPLEHAAAHHQACSIQCGRHCPFKHFLTGRLAWLEKWTSFFSWTFLIITIEPSDNLLPSPIYTLSETFRDYFNIAIPTQGAGRALLQPQVSPFPSFLFAFISFWIHKNSSWNLCVVVGVTEMRKPELGLYCFLAGLLGFHCLALFVCLLV